MVLLFVNKQLKLKVYSLIKNQFTYLEIVHAQSVIDIFINILKLTHSDLMKELKTLHFQATEILQGLQGLGNTYI